MIFDARMFPILLIVLDIAAMIAYGFEGDWRRMVYWGAAGLLTLSITV